MHHKCALMDSPDESQQEHVEMSMVEGFHADFSGSKKFAKLVHPQHLLGFPEAFPTPKKTTHLSCQKNSEYAERLTDDGVNQSLGEGGRGANGPVMADFGHTDFGQLFGRLWPNRLWPVLVFLMC